MQIIMRAMMRTIFVRMALISSDALGGNQKSEKREALYSGIRIWKPREACPYGEIYGYTDFAPGDSDYSFLGGIGYSWERISLYLIDKTGEEPVVMPVIERDGNEVYPPIGPSVLS